jgi:magnesium transporter
MSVTEREDLVEGLRDALRLQQQGDSDALVQALEGRHPADIAEAMSELPNGDALTVFSLLDNARAAEVLDELHLETQRYLLDNDVPGRIADLLDRLPMDDAAYVVANMADDSPERAEVLVQNLEKRSPEDAAEVRELLSYNDDSAGRLMTDKFVRLSASMTVDDAFVAVRRSDPEVETLSDLYVVQNAPDGGELLIGVLSLRDLVRARSYQTIREIMVPEPITVNVDTDQQEVARIIAKYDFMALPVLDDKGYLAGIITVDDVIDVLVDEFNEDYMKLVGSDAEEMDRRTPVQVAKLRLPWLMGTMLIELGAGGVISHFDWVLREVILLASFMPVISAISGNVGLQAAAIVVRGLDTGHISLDNMGKAVRKELLTSLLMALVCGIILGLVGVIWSRHLPFGLVIGGAMTASMLTAGMMGTIIPMFSKKLGFDPAASAGPFETAFQDVIGYAVFLWLASLLINYLK